MTRIFNAGSFFSVPELWNLFSVGLRKFRLKTRFHDASPNVSTKIADTREDCRFSTIQPSGSHTHTIVFASGAW